MKIDPKTEKIENLASALEKFCPSLEYRQKNELPSYHPQRCGILYCLFKKIHIPKNEIKKTKQIGIDYAGKFKDKLLRI